MKLWKRFFGTHEEKRQIRIVDLTAKLKRLLARRDAAGDDLSQFSRSRGMGMSKRPIGLGIGNFASNLNALDAFLERVGTTDKQLLEDILDALPSDRRMELRSELEVSEWYPKLRGWK